jgi:MATE family, multidrug efflux pump
MKDLTKGPIGGHILQMALPIAMGMILQTLYYVVDLYFVAKLGDAAIAGVSAAGNVFFIVLALTQMLGVSTVALISHAVGRKDREDANHVFNQSVAFALLLTAVTLAFGYGLANLYMDILGADAATRAAGVTYLHWFLPGLALQFGMVVMGSALRGTGIVKPTMIVQMVTVVMNAVLAPILIAGWGTGKALGVAGAGLATSLSVAAGVVMLAVYFARLEKYVTYDVPHMKPKMKTWLRMLNIGIPAGGEFFLLAIFQSTVYWIIRDFGPVAQAGFGLGGRIMQMVFLPAMAIAFAVAPIAGQNFGAKLPDRVRETFRTGAIASAVVMLAASLFVQWKGETLIRFFTGEPAVVAQAYEFLHIVSWNFFAMGIVMTASSTFQALGNTKPAFLSTAVRLILFVIPAVWWSRQPGFELVHVWYISVVSVLMQMLVSLALVKREFRLRLGAAGADQRIVTQGT